MVNEHMSIFVDIDECSESKSGCSHICVNLPGSFECRCPAGLSLGTNKKTCSGLSANSFLKNKSMTVD